LSNRCFGEAQKSLIQGCRIAQSAESASYPRPTNAREASDDWINRRLNP